MKKDTDTDDLFVIECCPKPKPKSPSKYHAKPSFWGANVKLQRTVSGISSNTNDLTVTELTATDLEIQTKFSENANI